MASIGTEGSNPILNVPHATDRSTSKSIGYHGFCCLGSIVALTSLFKSIVFCVHLCFQRHRFSLHDFGFRASSLRSLPPHSLNSRRKQKTTAGRSRRNRNSGHFLTPPSTPSSSSHRRVRDVVLDARRGLPDVVEVDGVRGRGVAVLVVITLLLLSGLKVEGRRGSGEGGGRRGLRLRRRLHRPRRLSVADAVLRRERRGPHEGRQRRWRRAVVHGLALLGGRSAGASGRGRVAHLLFSIRDDCLIGRGLFVFVEKNDSQIIL